MVMNHFAHDYHYYTKAIAGERLPLCLLDLDLLEENARSLLHRSGHLPVRLATKSLRSIEVIRTILGLDARFQGLMAYSAAEAAFLAAKGFDDILIGYPTAEPADVKAALTAAGPTCRIRFMICDPTHARLLNQVATELGVTAEFCIDLNHAHQHGPIFFGVRRSAVTSIKDVETLMRSTATLTRLKFCGFMGYDAQLAGVADAAENNWAKNRIVSWMKGVSLKKINAQRLAISNHAKAKSWEVSVFNGGGTGSLHYFAHDSVLTELTAGSGFYAPRLFDFYQNMTLRPAMLFALPVTRKPAPGWITCHGGGYIASGMAGADRLPNPWLPKGLVLSRFEGAGEVQTPVNGEVSELHIGDPVFFRHAKAGELCEHFNTIHVVRSGKIIGRYQTYRGEGKCFL